MKLVKSKPRYKCDFCRMTLTKEAMERHERRCFRNPNRICDYCDNTGFGHEQMWGGDAEVECPFCKKFRETKMDFS